jgi:leucyl-tRNA synthetase
MSAEYTPKNIETKWQDLWQKKQLYKVSTNTQKPKYYVLDMFPYPSGAGLHVGHPLGYIASDIIARYKRLKGFNVLHPMGFDSFGLPAEQYAIETGQHPKITTENNIATFKNQLGKIGFCYDWDKEIRTSSPDYYKWTQWIFKQLFESWYNNKSKKAENIGVLVAEFEKNGNANVDAACDEDTQIFSATEWQNFSAKEKSDKLLQYRLTYLADAFVNWCPALGSVLANDEVKDGVSERGGHPVERKKMRQWMMRITAYAERLLNDLDTIEWSESIKEIQRNWIGKSLGAELRFKISPLTPEGGTDETTSKTPPSGAGGLGVGEYLEVFTTRIDTTFGVTYLAIAPEHELVATLTTEEQKQAVAVYVEKAANRSERERMTEVKTSTGVFTGSYVINPFNNEKIPVWIADYVLAGYGTGVVMAVPSSDDRDFRFAKQYNLPIINVIEGAEELENPTDKKYGKMVNSGFLNGLDTDEAILKAIEFAENQGVGTARTNYRMRDAVFGRQRYWGEPVPIYFDENNIPKLLSDEELPLLLPEIDQYKPTENGEPPLGRATNWKYSPLTPEGGTDAVTSNSPFGGWGVTPPSGAGGLGFEYELSTMPGWAGSSWYWLRYMDNKNDKEFVSKEAENYWQSVDLYVGGAEHGTGHLLYSRFWNKFLYDLGYVSTVEPFKKLINQGMIQGRSNFVYKLKDSNKFVSLKFKDKYEAANIQELHVDVNIVENDVLDLEKFKAWRPEYADAEFEMEDGKYVCGYTVEKMSKRWYNVVNPDDVVNRYSADTLRLYEMFLGPLEQFKPWNMQGIDGTHKFLKKLWRLFYDDKGNFRVTDDTPTKDELKTLHKTIKKIEDDMERFSFNTPVSTFMICVNELTEQKCYKKQILADLLVILAPYAPHIVEELWFALQYPNQNIENWQAEYSVMNATFPTCNESYLVESSFEYPVSINGKMRHKLTLSLDLTVAEIEKIALADETVQKWLEGKTPKKVIIVVGKVVNVVV